MNEHKAPVPDHEPLGQDRPAVPVGINVRGFFLERPFLKREDFGEKTESDPPLGYVAPGSVNVIAGPTSTGKSLLALDIALKEQECRGDKHTVAFALSSVAPKLFLQQWSFRLAKLSYDDAIASQHKEEEEQRLMNCMEEVIKTYVKFFDVTDFSYANFLLWLQEIPGISNPSMVIIDDLQGLCGRHESANFMSLIRQMANKLNISFFVICQADKPSLCSGGPVFEGYDLYVGPVLHHVADSIWVIENKMNAGSSKDFIKISRARQLKNRFGVLAACELGFKRSGEVVRLPAEGLA